MSRDCFSYWDGRLGPDADSNITPRSRAEATPDWYTQMVDELETERQAHLYTKEILTDLIAELRASHTRARCPDECGRLYDICECSEGWDTGWDACMSMAATYQAEARLKEVQGD